MTLPSKQFRLLLNLLQRGAIRLGQNLLPAVAQPQIELLRPQDERHPVMILGHGFIRRGGKHLGENAKGQMLNAKVIFLASPFRIQPSAFSIFFRVAVTGTHANGI